MKATAFFNRIILLSIICSSSLIFAQSKTDEHTATIRGRSEVLVTKQKVLLSDIAEITAQNSEAQLALSRIELTASPKPGATTELAAQKILEVLQFQGVDLKKVGYILAPSVKIRRASRTISEPEIEAALQAAIARESSEMILRSVNLPRNTQVFTGPVNIQATLRAANNSNQRSYEILLSNADGEKLSLEGRAEIDSWKQIPVASRSLAPGSILGAIDFGLARLNSKDLPKDAAFDSSELLGKRLQREVGVGQVFRVSSLERPPLIKSGSRISMIVRSGTLEASASGIAMQDGFSGDLIEVRNDNSRQIVSGQVKNQTTVEIIQ